MCRSATLGLTGWLQETQKICRSVSSPSASPTCGATDRRVRAEAAPCGTPPCGTPHLFVLLDLLLLGVGDDGLQLVETFLHQREAEPGGLLLLPDPLQLPPPHLLCHAGTLLPLLDPLGEDLKDPAAGQRCTVSLRRRARLRAYLGLTWRRASCRSPPCSTWSWSLPDGCSLDPGTALKPRPHL